MNYLDLYSSYPDYTIVAAWDSQIKEANKSAWIAETLTRHGDELFSRFAACYAELRALPRGARRALQRKLARSSELATVLPEYLQQGGRRLQHRMASSLAGAALLLALGQGVVTAATITVTTNDPNIAADGQCSLIEAIVNANNNAATHADCPAGSGADTIVLPASANIALSNVSGGVFAHAVGLPLITSPIIIQGNGTTIAREANAPNFGLMLVTNSGELTLQNMTLSGGQTFTRGGAVHNYGALTIENSTISGNSAVYGGGGVTNWRSLIIENSTISDNDSSGYWGGGVTNYGTLTIENSTISGNTAYVGGGVNNFGTTTIENSTISGNTAGNGGGMANYDTATIENSTVSSNTADRGGGIFNSGKLTIANSAISGNTANIGSEIFNAVTIGATTLAAAEVGASFSGDLMISGGVGSYNVSIVQGRLPRGLSLGNDGVISGTPSPTARTEKITVQITDSVNESASQTFTITVLKALHIAGKLKTGRVGNNYSGSLKTRGGLGPFSWNITSGAVPGLSFNNATGALTGIPTQAGEFPLTVQVSDALGGVASENLTVKIK